MTMEPPRSVVICVILIFSIGSGTSINGGTGNWGQTIICPNADVCLTEAQQELLYPVHNGPCCTDCNCNGDCSCCSDKTSDSGSPSKRVCKSTMVKKRGSNKDKYFYDGFIDGINSYFITDRCPTDEQNIDVREKCLSIDKTTLDDYIWVSDTTTGKIFQNHHCAKCHGTKDWKSWNIRTQCSPLSDASFVNITATLYSENCNIINEAPEELAAKTANDRCFNPTISFCNQTGYWNIYHDFVYTGCNFNTAPHLPNEEMAVDVFKNMFCYICNTDDVSSTERVCLAALFNISDMTSNPYIQRSNSITFSALIDYRGGSEDEKGSSGCAVDQIYDKYMGKCRNLLCPFGSGPSAGQCKPLTVTMNNLGVRILLKLIFEWQLLNDSKQNQTATLSFEDGEGISKSISKALNVNPCTFCKIDIWKNKNNGISLHQSDGVFDLLMNTNGNCQYEWLHRNMDEAIGKVVNVTLKDSRSISVHLHYAERPLILSRDYLYMYMKKSKMCQHSVTLSEKYCPKISLTFSEVQVLQNQRAKRNLVPLFNGMHANETTILFMCLSDYYKSMTLTKASVGIQMFWDALLLSLPLLQILMSL